MEPHSATVQ
uniref:Uncharacterized protein n=1 Tax=Macrostomum lignano TaxID=282301 RepID=A0A1I8FEZ9_9PLAT